MALKNSYSEIDISIHAPRAGSDLRKIEQMFDTEVDFNPRSPCGERLEVESTVNPGIWISIHAPRAGSDSNLIRQRGIGRVFQSTLPVRGATRPIFTVRMCIRISIHAPRAGSDSINAHFSSVYL